ncbi:MAG: hypothetical protein HY858_01510 [Candidatus Solibacter usitatus]|nr:hypothetical protein [Candidatus Solibacter usitatus]
MSAVTLHDLNQRYVRLTDRCRSQWTFYQLLQGLFKHLRGTVCPVELDFPPLFSRLREVGVELGHPETMRTEKSIAALNVLLDKQAKQLLDIDGEVPPSLLRRFFDRLRNQDEKVLMAIIKFYLDARPDSEDRLDKLDLLFTRMAEIPRQDGGSFAREKHEIERLVQPLLLQRQVISSTPDNEVDILLHAVADLRTELLACRSFNELVQGGSLDRFRTLKRRLGETLLHPRLLPSLLDTTVAIKNRFRELWEDEESQIMDDTNRVIELKRQLAGHPELVNQELREALETFDLAHRKYDQARQDENLRREDIAQLRRTLNLILEQFDTTLAPVAVTTPLSFSEPVSIDDAPDPVESGASGDEHVPHQIETNLPVDPLLSEYLSKIVFALELVGRDKDPAEAVRAKELATLRLEPLEVAACRRVMEGQSREGALTGQRDRLLLHAAALRVRLDEEAREIDRLHRRGSERLPDLIERATQSLQRAAEMERRFQWFIDDALYRGDTEHLEPMYRSRFRLLRAYSGLWLIHNERGGTSPF